MITIVIDDCDVEVTPKVKSMSIVGYDINIVGYEQVEVLGTREFSSLVNLIQELILKAMSNIDSMPNLED